jgi:phosphorylcholine metabolism protein LicD
MLGIRSFVTSSKLKKEASSENAYISELENWIHANIHADSINDGINQSLSIEELYPLRAEKIRSLLLSKDEQMDKAMLEHYVEQTYAALFESGSAQ